MSTSPVTPPAGYTVEPSSSDPFSGIAQPVNADPFADIAKTLPPGYAVEPDSQPVKAGEQLNDVGAKVIVPTDNESFTDTVQRAVKLSKARQAAGTEQAVINKEMATAPTKAPQVLAAAATAGIAGPAALALPGEIGGSIAAMTNAVKLVGEWANKNPVHAYLVYQALKELIPGAKEAVGIVKGIPD